MDENNNPLAKVEAITKKQPWYVWAGGIATAGIVGWYVLKNRAAQAAKDAMPTDPNALTPADQNAIENGFQLASMAGMPYGYISDNGPVDNYPNVPPGGTPPTPPTTPPGPIIPPVPPPGGPLPPTTSNAPLISDAFKVWFGKGNQIYYGTWVGDQKHFTMPAGATLRAGSDGRYWLVEPGNKLQLLTNHFLYGQSGPGAPPHGNGGMPSPWQTMLNSGRNTIDQHAVLHGLIDE